MVTVFLDECGFTGEDLTNADQPVFVLAGHDLPEEVCAGMKRQHFGDVRAAELKHMALQKRPRQQQMVIALMRDLLANHATHVHCEIVHKKYVLMAKMVDLLAEPVAHRLGFDLYARGGNIAMTNVMWMTLPVFGSEALVDAMLTSFNRMMRERTPEAYEEFFRLIFKKRRRKNLEELLTYFRAWHLEFGPRPLLAGPRGDLDVAFTCALELMSSWRKRNPLPTEIEAIHDASSNMSRDKPVWDALMNPKLEPKVTGYDRRTREFPIAVHRTRFESSKSLAGLQIADVIAGAVTRAALSVVRSGKDDLYGNALLDIVNNSAFVDNMLWPGQGVTPAQLGTEGPKYGDLIDDTGAILRGAGVRLGTWRSR